MPNTTEIIEMLHVLDSTCKPESIEWVAKIAADKIEELLAERDRYKSFFDRIKDLPDCNICLKKNGCEFVPRPGEHTRINCAFCLTAPPKED